MGNALGDGCRALSEEVPEGYKWTEVGVIPQDWTIVRLGRISSMKSGVGITHTNIERIFKIPLFWRKWSSRIHRSIYPFWPFLLSSDAKGLYAGMS